MTQLPGSGDETDERSVLVSREEQATKVQAKNS